MAHPSFLTPIKGFFAGDHAAFMARGRGKPTPPENLASCRMLAWDRTHYGPASDEEVLAFLARRGPEVALSADPPLPDVAVDPRSRHFDSRLTLTSEECVSYALHVRPADYTQERRLAGIAQKSDLWLALRRGLISGTKQCAATGNDHHLSRAELLHEQIHGTRTETNEFMIHGTVHEPYAQDATIDFFRQNGAVVTAFREEGLRIPYDPPCRANVGVSTDGFVEAAFRQESLSAFERSLVRKMSWNASMGELRAYLEEAPMPVTWIGLHAEMKCPQPNLSGDQTKWRHGDRARSKFPEPSLAYLYQVTGAQGFLRTATGEKESHATAFVQANETENCVRIIPYDADLFHNYICRLLEDYYLNSFVPATLLKQRGVPDPIGTVVRLRSFLGQ